MRNKCTCSINRYINTNLNVTGQRTVSVVLLDKTNFELNFDQKTTVQEIFQKVCEKLELKETYMFGLAQKMKDEYYFLSNEEKILKYLQKNICCNQTTNTAGVNSSSSGNSSASTTATTTTHSTIKSTNDLLKNLKSESLFGTLRSINESFLSELSKTQNEKCQTNFILHFRVQFYVTDPLLLCDPISRQLYYLQLKENFLNINHNLSQENYFKLAALSLQADFGDYNPSIHKEKYFDINQYFPYWVINSLGEDFILNNMPILHSEQVKYNLTQKAAQIKYCLQLSNEDYPYNIHLYRVYKNKDELNTSICLAIAPKAILVFDLKYSNNEIFPISTFPLASLTKLNFDKKKFEITISIDSKSRRYSYHTNCEKRSKYLLELSKITHAFTVNIFSRLADQKTLANYVTESYKENMFIINENQLDNFEEREIGTAITSTPCIIANNTNTIVVPTTPNNFIFKQHQQLNNDFVKTNYKNSLNSLSSSSIYTDNTNNAISLSDSTSGIASITSDDSTRDSRQTRKRLAQFGNDGTDCSELLRKYSLLSYQDTSQSTSQPHQQQQLQQQSCDSSHPSNTKYKYHYKENSRSLCDTSANIADTKTQMQQVTPSATNNVHYKLNYFKSPQYGIGHQNDVHLHSTHSCHVVPNSSPTHPQCSRSSYIQNQQQYPLNTSYLDYRQTFTSTQHHRPTPSSCHMHPLKALPLPTQQQTVPPPPLPSLPPPPPPYYSKPESNYTFSNSTSSNDSFNTSNTNVTSDDTASLSSIQNTSNVVTQQQQQQQLANALSQNLIIQHYSDTNLNRTISNIFTKSPYSTLTSTTSTAINTIKSTATAIIPPYVEYKKPPSYEESIKKTGTHSKESSSSSSCYEPTNTLRIKNFKYDKKGNREEQSNDDDDDDDSYDDSDSDVNMIKINDDDDKTRTLRHNDASKITINEQNLEQIRLKAASMSLPLLTALCSDKSLIRCLSKRNENKQAS